MYCVKSYKTALNFTEHIKLHGPDRFECYLCNLKLPSQRGIKTHMKKCHDIINVDFIPECVGLTDLNKDNFIVLGVEVVQQKVNQEQPNYTNNSVNSLMPQQNTRLKRKHYSTVSYSFILLYSLNA